MSNIGGSYMTENLNELAKQIADGLGTTVDNIMPSLQHYLDLAIRSTFINNMVASIGMTLVLLIGIVFSIIGYKKYDGSSWDNDTACCFGIIGGIALVISIIALIFTIPPIFNPEYYAIKDIISQLIVSQ